VSKLENGKNQEYLSIVDLYCEIIIKKLYQAKQIVGLNGFNQNLHDVLKELVKNLRKCAQGYPYLQGKTKEINTLIIDWTKKEESLETLATEKQIIVNQRTEFRELDLRARKL